LRKRKEKEEKGERDGYPPSPDAAEAGVGETAFDSGPPQASLSAVEMAEL
jgi:hypothetical protein